MIKNEIKKVDLIIKICTTLDSDKNYKIKPLSNLIECGYNIHSFNKTELWVVKHKNYNMDGPILFGNNRWVSYEVTERHLLHLENENEISFQLRIYALISHFNGHGKGCKGEKLSTLSTKHMALKKFGGWLLKRGYSSFHQLEKLAKLKLRNLLFDYVMKEVVANSPSNKPRVFRDCFNPVKSLGLISERTSSLFQEALNNVFTQPHKPLSHPIIPTDIAQKVASYAKAVVEGCDKRLNDLERANNKLIEHLEKNIHIYERKEWKTGALLSHAAIKAGVYVELQELYKYFIDLKVAVYIHILLFTGMRYNEALSCKIGCTNKSQPNHQIYRVEALTSKTTDTTYLDTWIANEDTHKAISALESYVAILGKRGEVIVHNYSHVVSTSFMHNIKVGMSENRLFGISSSANSISYAKSGRFEKFEIKSPHFKSKFDLTVTDKSLEELNRLEQNYSQIRGLHRGKLYIEGDTLRLTNHMFRHTFAYFVVANKLGEFDDIADQFKHLSLAMTKVYADKGILSFWEVSDLVDGYENLMIDAIATELTEQASNNTLRGGGGKRFNKAVQELVIGISSSKSLNAEVITQVHFKDQAEFKQFLVKNIETIRGLPHGYCTAGDSCKLKGSSVPSGCVNCGSFIITEAHKIHWRAIKKRAQEKLEKIATLSPEKQKDFELFVIAYKKDLKAAEEALYTTESKMISTRGGKYE